MSPETFNSLSREIRALFQALQRTSNALHQHRGINASMRAVLELLRETEPQTVPEMAAAKGVSRQHIQKIVNELLAVGFVERRNNPGHQRSDIIALTRKGRAEFSLLKKREQKAFGQLLPALSTIDAPLVLNALRQVRDALTLINEKENEDE